MSKFKFAVCAILFYFLMAEVGSGDDTWSRFRGPNGSGVSTTAGIPTTFGPDENLIWRVPLPPGHSSPIIRNGKIYVTAVDESKLKTICLDQQSGKVLWSNVSPRDRTTKLDFRNNAASPSPAVDSENVYVFFADFGLLAYTHDGVLRWKMPLEPFDNLYGMGASPIIVDDKLILVCDQNLNSFVLAVNKHDGEKAWRVSRPEATSGHCSPIVFETAAGEKQVVVVGSFFVTAYDVETGSKRWWSGGLCFEMKSTPVILDGVLFINGYGSPANQPGQEIEVAKFSETLQQQDVDRNGALSLSEMPDKMSKNFFPAVDLDKNGELKESEWSYYRASLASKNSMAAIRLGGSGDVTNENTLWMYHRNVPQLPSPVICAGKLFMISDSGIVTCLEPSTGEALHRGRLEGASGNYYSSPVVADGKMIFANTDGEIAVTRWVNNELKVLSVNKLGESCYATPAISEGKLYIRTEKALYAFD